jgi:hypothetical protein
MVNMALLHRIFVIHLLCARANSRHTKQTTDRPHMVLRRLAQLDLRAASTMPRLGQYLMSPHAFAMKPSPVKFSSARAFGKLSRRP